MQSYKTLPPAELAEWQQKVADYLTNEHPKCQSVTQWQDMPQIFVTEGCQLAMYIVRARDIARTPHAYKPQQAVKLIGGFLRSSLAAPIQTSPRTGGRLNSPAATPPQCPPVSLVGKESLPPARGEVGGGAQGRGANHLSDYIDTLPTALRQEAEHIDELYLQQATLARESDSLADRYQLAEKKGDTAELDIIQPDLERVNRQLVKVNQQLRAFWAKVDNLPAAPSQPSPKGEESGKPTTPNTQTTPLPLGRGREGAVAGALDLESIKKYLRRTDFKNTPEWRANVRERVQMLIDNGEKVSKRIRATLERAELTIVDGKVAPIE